MTSYYKIGKCYHSGNRNDNCGVLHGDASAAIVHLKAFGPNYKNKLLSVKQEWEMMDYYEKLRIRSSNYKKGMCFKYNMSMYNCAIIHKTKAQAVTHLIKLNEFGWENELLGSKPNSRFKLLKTKETGIKIRNIKGI